MPKAKKSPKEQPKEQPKEKRATGRKASELVTSGRRLAVYLTKAERKKFEARALERMRRAGFPRSLSAVAAEILLEDDPPCATQPGTAASA